MAAALLEAAPSAVGGEAVEVGMQGQGVRAIARWLVPAVTAALIFGVLPYGSTAFSYDPARIEATLLRRVLAAPQGDYDVIVRSTPGQTRRADRAGNALNKSGGKARHALPIVGGASGRAKGVHVLKLSRDPEVDYVSTDARISAQFDPTAGASNVTSPGVVGIGAPKVWSSLGLTGKGVGVAVIDSGVYAHPDLGDRILASVDFTAVTPTVSNVPLGDLGGHGTHVAGLIAGDGTASRGLFTGVAPEANIIDVRVIDANGNSNVSTILRGLMWVLQHRSSYNIRVVNMSLGATPSQSYRTDLLATAAEVLHFAGISVVVSAGNTGPGERTITSPATDPFVLSVGAIDDAATALTLDDTIASFSSRGPTPFDGLNKPDLVAPGRKMVSLRSPASTLDALYPERQVTVGGAVSPDYFRLSGTSMAAPVVAGVIALMYQRNNNLTPTTIRTRLTATASPLTLFGRYDQGAGMVNAYGAVTTNLAPTRSRRRASDFFARDMRERMVNQPLYWYDAAYNGGVDSRGIPWGNVSWDNVTWDPVTWDNLSWDSYSWDGISWENLSWDAVSWETAGALSGTGSGWSPVE